MLEGALEEASVLAELGDVGAVVVREHLVPEDRVGHLSPEEGKSVFTQSRYFDGAVNRA